MTRLAEILDQMSAVLNDLKTVMDQEQQHLSMGQINGSQLQWITEQKSSLLATLDYLEQLRRKEPNTANSVDISQRWQEITGKTQQLRQLNQHNGWLLEGQIERNQQALEMQKSSLLATLDYLEQLRRKEPNTANSVDISQRWQEITGKTQQLRQLNQHNGWLLEGQIERNQQALEMLKPHQEPTLYGANGQTSTPYRGSKKISI